MKKMTLLAGILVVALVFGMTVAGCAGTPPIISDRQVAGSWTLDVGDITYIINARSTTSGNIMYSGTYSVSINEHPNVETGFWTRFGNTVTFTTGDNHTDGGRRYTGTITGNKMIIRNSSYTKQ